MLPRFRADWEEQGFRFQGAGFREGEMKNEIRSYRDLIVWQLSRAVVSIPANIAEGHSRGNRKSAE